MDIKEREIMRLHFDYVNGLKKKIAELEAQAKPQWRKPDDPPDDDRSILLAVRTGQHMYLEPRYYDNDTAAFLHCGEVHDPDETVIGWMEQPVLPDIEKEEVNNGL